jgi:5-methylcytosine-specific restriction endonuclease McrA
MNSLGGRKAGKWRRKIYGTKRLVLDRDFYTCQYCGYSSQCLNEIRGLCIDHIIPVSYGGGNSPENLVCACDVCNRLVSDLYFDTFEEKRSFILERLSQREIKSYWKDL